MARNGGVENHGDHPHRVLIDQRLQHEATVADDACQRVATPEAHPA
jgi:hypothetical protein